MKKTEKNREKQKTGENRGKYGKREINWGKQGKKGGNRRTGKNIGKQEKTEENREYRKTGENRQKYRKTGEKIGK